MKHQHYDDNGTLHLLDGCTPEEHKRWQQNVQRYNSSKRGNSRGEPGGTMHWCTEKQMEDAIERTKEEVILTKEQFECLYPPRRIVRIWDWLTKARFSYLSSFIMFLIVSIIREVYIK